MLSTEEARALIEGGEEYPDAEIEQIRDDMQILAELAFEGWLKEKNRKMGKVVMPRPTTL